MIEKAIEKLFDRRSLAVLIVGLVVFILAAIGLVPIGNRSLPLTDWGWRIAVAVVGLVVAAVGGVMLWREAHGSITARLAEPIKAEPMQGTVGEERSQTNETASQAASGESIQVAGEHNVIHIYPFPQPGSAAGSSSHGWEIPVDPRLIYIAPPVEPTRFKTVEFPVDGRIHYYSWPYVPTGLLLIHNIPFYLHPVVGDSKELLGHQVVTVQPSRYNAPDSAEFTTGVTSVVKVHFLWSAGHGWVTHEGVQFLGKRIGYIDLISGDAGTHTVDIVLGHNIREWAFGNSPNLVRDVDYSVTRPAWVSHDNTRRIDLMTVDLPETMKRLVAIRVTAKFEDDHPGKLIATPSIQISAVTCERVT